MPQAFVIMQIGNPDLDRLYTDAIVPAVVGAGLEPRRVDRHNQGGLLKSEIVRFIQDSEILIADLTNERPNVYLEIGYAMGLDKFRNLILTVREDHFADSPEHVRGGPKIHFDLAGYDILSWKAGALPTFQHELERRIRRRAAIVATGPAASLPVWDMEWVQGQRDQALVGLASLGRSGFMEARAALHPPKIDRDQTQLNEAASQAPIRTFGWPIAVYLHRDDARPRPRADGIFAEISSQQRESYDYWAIRRSGDFYFLGSLFEDQRRPGEIFFNTRIVRVTEVVLYCLRLYSFLGVDRSSRVSIAVRHEGLRDRVLTAASMNRSLSVQRASVEDQVESEIAGTLDEIEAGLVQHVRSLVAPLFRLFDFFELSDSIYEDIVNKFVAGQVS